jgi:flavin reductase (DIM6/NTAB) family NADH-FMN oxidoreductase RutF
MQAGARLMDRAVAKEVLQRIPYGLYVVCSRDGERFRAMIADWVMQVSFHPLMIAAAMETDSLMHRAVQDSGYFSVNLLPAGGKSIAKDFLKSPVGEGTTLGGRQMSLSAGRVPFLADAAAAIECRMTADGQYGDHNVVFGEVTDAALLQPASGILTLQETGWKYSQ